MSTFSKEANGAFLPWDPKAEEDLEKRDRALRQVMTGRFGIADADAPAGLDKTNQDRLQQQVMERLRDKATEQCLKALDQTLEQVAFSSHRLPLDKKPVDGFGVLSFGDKAGGDGEWIQFRFQLFEGKLVDTKSILEYDQRLWVSPFPNPPTLAIVLFPQGNGDPLIAEGPAIEAGVLTWRVSASGLKPGLSFQARLECFVPAHERGQIYARIGVGQAASSASDSASKQATQESAEPGGPILIFSTQGAGRGELIIGVEWHPAQPTGEYFRAFKKRLFTALANREIAYSEVSEVPSRCRVYFRVNRASKKNVERSISLLNQQVSG